MSANKCCKILIYLHRNINQNHLTKFYITSELISNRFEKTAKGRKFMRKWHYTKPLTIVLLNPDMPYLCKHYRSRSTGFWSQLIWICTICHWVCEFIPHPGSSNIWLAIWNGRGILIHLALQELKVVQLVSHNGSYLACEMSFKAIASYLASNVINAMPDQDYSDGQYTTPLNRISQLNNTWINDGKTEYEIVSSPFHRSLFWCLLRIVLRDSAISWKSLLIFFFYLKPAFRFALADNPG